LDAARNHGANVVICYIDDEQTYETFVDTTGFNQTLSRIQYLVSEAHKRQLKVVCYLNGLEVITVGARTHAQMPSLARNMPAVLQQDLNGYAMVWYTVAQTSWIPPDSEDAWASPLSSWKDLFKARLQSLAATGLDGVYIDATFLPGIDDYGIKWASTDPGFNAAFAARYGGASPAAVDWNALSWRKWIYFRHEVIRDYLAECASIARTAGMLVFFESSSSDRLAGTWLGNDTPFTISGGVACSPEIEPEGDYRAAFRMSKVTRDADQDLPMWFLGWPENAEEARREFAITLCHSGNYYPTADALEHYPADAFPFVDQLREPILSKRVSVQHTALVYPMRSKDYTWNSQSTFDAYSQAFSSLIRQHVDFRIIPLASITTQSLAGIDTLVLAGAECISDDQYALMKNK